MRLRLLRLPLLHTHYLVLGAMKAFLQRTLNPFKYLLNVSVALLSLLLPRRRKQLDSGWANGNILSVSVLFFSIPAKSG